MPEPIDFYFDFSSPYGYLAATQVDDLAARYDRDVRWHPILLGVIFKVTGQMPLVDQPLRGDYHRRDIVRSAGFLGVPYKWPPKFPFPALAASRIFYGLADRDRPTAQRFARAVYDRAFGEGLDVMSDESLQAVLQQIGLPDETLRWARDERAKEWLRQATDAAIAKGVFGSPFIVIDREAFWGVDRLPQIARWLEIGGW